MLQSAIPSAVAQAQLFIFQVGYFSGFLTPAKLLVSSLHAFERKITHWSIYVIYLYLVKMSEYLLLIFCLLYIIWLEKLISCLLNCLKIRTYQ